MVDAVELLRFTVEEGASDLHVSAGEPPRVRIHGDIRPLDLPPMSPEEAHQIIFAVMDDTRRAVYQEQLEVDFSYAIGEGQRFRVNVFRQDRGEAAVFRVIQSQIPSMDDLGLPAVLKDFCEREKGLVLVTGPTGSGKSTTLASMVDRINTQRPAHILTLEDPIEFIHSSKRSLVNQRGIGEQSHSFASALRAALREDPDVILVGEMRDLETMSLALSAAETGHLVFGTLHTSSAAKAVDRIVDAFPAGQQAQVRTMLSESLAGVAAQILMKKRKGGRVAAIEVLVGTPAVRNLIRENKTFQLVSVMQASGQQGMVTMQAAVAALVQKGVVAPAEASLKVPGYDWESLWCGKGGG